jgi:hypothetical protein
MQRESDEWSSNYTFLLRLNVPSDQIGSNKEVVRIKTFSADPDKLVDEVGKLYHHTTKGEDCRGKLVPNATGMLALYVRYIGSDITYGNLLDRLSEAAQRKESKLEIRDYSKSPKINPFM